MNRLRILCCCFVMMISAVPASAQWITQPTSPDVGTFGKTEDGSFINAATGWLVYPNGELWRTANGGEAWQLINTKPAAYFRCVGFANAQKGWVGSLFGGTQDSLPLYQTTDGGVTLNRVPKSQVSGPMPPGLCGIWVVDSNIVYAVGQYSANPHLLKTTNGGQTWVSKSMSQYVNGLVDCYFFTPDSGIAAGYAKGSPAASILFTSDGGDTWEERYTSIRPNIFCWKISFPTRQIGYISTQDFSNVITYFRTLDGGESWEEWGFTSPPGTQYSAEGIGFITPSLGWIGAYPPFQASYIAESFRTTDGGASWQLDATTKNVNRFRFLGDSTGYAMGQKVYKYTKENIPPVALPLPRVMLQVFTANASYQSPTAAELSLRQPRTADSLNYDEVILRNGVQVFRRALRSGTTVSLDTGLVRNATYTYSAFNIYKPTNDTGAKRTQAITVGVNAVPPPTAFTAISSFTTPTSASVAFTQATRADSADFDQVLQRNGSQLSRQSYRSGTLEIVDAGLTTYQIYTYKVFNIYKPTGDSSLALSATVSAGGSPKPIAIPASDLTVKSNGSTALIKFKTPTLHDDFSSLNNLLRVKFSRNNAPYDSLALAPTDTGKVLYHLNTPPRSTFGVYGYGVSFVGNTFGIPVSGEGGRTNSPNIQSGRTYALPFSEDFELNRQNLTSLPTWDSLATPARGAYSFGVLNYAANANESAYLRLFQVQPTTTLEFYTVCRTESGQDFGLVEVSKDRGTTWTEKLRLDESAHSEWQSGQNVFFKKSVALSEFVNDTVLIRFRLTSNSAVQKFGWVIDDLIVSGTSSAGSGGGVVYAYRLEQNYPNPFNPETVIEYELRERGTVSLKVFDVLGREVASLVNETKAAGRYEARFNAARLSSGIYFYKLSATGFTATKKMVLLK